MGMAIAARMPMMMMTTKSSMRVNPWSFEPFFSRDFRSRVYMGVLSLAGVVTRVCGTSGGRSSGAA
jgi:hypothetical protein